jgi:hypothetical protein
MATFSGQYTGQSTGPNLSNLYQQNQQPTGMTQQWWRPPSGGSTGLSNIGGSQIGLSRPQMSPAPPVYPQMSNAYPTSKGGAPQYNRDVQQQEQDWINQNSGTQWQSGEGATVPYPQMHGGNTTTNGITYNAQGQQLDSHGNVAYGDWGSNNSGGSGSGGGQSGLPGRDDPSSGPTYGGVGMNPGAPGPQGANQDWYNPDTGQWVMANQQATGWIPPYGGLSNPAPQTSGEGGTGGATGGAPGSGYPGPMGYGQWGVMPEFTAYAGMNPQNQSAYNNWMAQNIALRQSGQNAYQYEQDRAQAALQFAQSNGLNWAQFAQQAGLSERQIIMAEEAQRQNLNNQYAYQGMDRNRLEFEQEMARLQNTQQQQQWGAGHVLAQAQQGHQQGMDVKNLALAQLKEEHDYYVQTGQLDLAKKTQDQYYSIQQGRLGLDTVANQRANEQFYAGQANEMTRFNQGLDWQKNQFGQEMGLRRDQFGLESELGRGNLALQQNRFGLEDYLGRGNLALEQELGRGNLALQQGRFAQDQFEFGAQMDFEQQKNAQQFGLAVSDQELDWMVQTGQLDLARQQFGQGQYEFGAEMGQRSYEFDAQQRQQMAIEQARLAQAEKAANVAAVGRTLAPSAKWLRAV